MSQSILFPVLFTIPFIQVISVVPRENTAEGTELHKVTLVIQTVPEPEHGRQPRPLSGGVKCRVTRLGLSPLCLRTPLPKHT